MSTSVNVLIGKCVEENDLYLLFSPIADDDISVSYKDASTMGVILKDFGVFKSRSEARANKMDGPVPTGYSEHIFGKGKKRKVELFIWNPSKRTSDYPDEEEGE
jgi:hypothetical protein